MKRNRLWLSFALVTFVLACLLVLPTQADAEVVESGTCGANLYWTLDDTNTLTICGTGPMENYYRTGPTGEGTCNSPFYGCRYDRVIFEEGVTSIGELTFHFSGITELWIPVSMKGIYDEAFYCASVGHVYYAGLEKQWKEIYINPSNYDLTSAPITYLGKIPDGWVQENGKRYYYQEGKKVIGWLELEGNWYYFKTTGELVTGWLEYGPVWYYFYQSTGAMYKGFLNYNGQWYFFNDIGRMHIGWTQYNGSWYYMDANGHRVSGTVTIDGAEHLFAENGVWIRENVRNGWVQENGRRYYYQEGKKVIGWLELEGNWYYFKTTGELVTGWLKYGPVWYYFYQSTGAMYKGFLNYNGQWYFFNDIGRMHTGWAKYDGNWYYMDTNGHRVTGTRTIGGKTYNFDQSGICLNP